MQSAKTSPVPAPAPRGTSSDRSNVFITEVAGWKVEQVEHDGASRKEPDAKVRGSFELTICV